MPLQMSLKKSVFGITKINVASLKCDANVRLRKFSAKS